MLVTATSSTSMHRDYRVRASRRHLRHSYTFDYPANGPDQVRDRVVGSCCGNLTPCEASAGISPLCSARGCSATCVRSPPLRSSSARRWVRPPPISNARAITWARPNARCTIAAAHNRVRRAPAGVRRIAVRRRSPPCWVPSPSSRLGRSSIPRPVRLRPRFSCAHR